MIPKSYTRVLRSFLAALMLAAPLTACNGSGGSTSKPSAQSDTSLLVIHEGASAYTISADTDTTRMAACSIRDVLANTTGVTLPIGKSEEKRLHFADATPDEVGNYGYDISTKGGVITIKAASLAGFDQAIARLLSDTLREHTMDVPLDYAAADSKSWEENYSDDTSRYNQTYLNDMFYNDKNDAVAYVSNAMWHKFTMVDDGNSSVYLFGNEPTYFEWVSEKVAFSGNRSYIDTLKHKIISFPQTSTGYMWSWGDRPSWRVDDQYSIHYDGTFRFISAVYDILTWENSTDFLYSVDQTIEGEDNLLDASCGRTVLEKAEACMSYILNYLEGNKGYIHITEASTYLTEDGSKRFDEVPSGFAWNNTGLPGGSASNYWDNLPFGNYDAYENALFYQALNSMAGIYRMLGGEYIEKAEKMEALAVTVKEKFDELYWSDSTGRYIGCIDTAGKKVDYGFTFLNFEALKYGLGDAEKAKSIFDWIDGDRIVSGDTKTGDLILAYAPHLVSSPKRYEVALQRNLRLAATSNTVAISGANGPAWWHAPAAINVNGNAAYGKHLENGGYIFYPVFYELMARTQYEGAQSTTDRLMMIADVYKMNGLHSKVGTWVEGLIQEFPESGLVPTAYLYSLMGVEATHDGLHIKPNFNDVYEYMGVKKITYGGNDYALQVNRDGSCVITPADGKLDINLHYTPARFNTASFTVTLTKTDGCLTTFTAVTPDADGTLHIVLSGTDIASVSIEPVLAWPF